MLDWLKFWNWFRKSELPALPEPVDRTPAPDSDADIEAESIRCAQFLELAKQGKDVSRDTFNWHRNIFQTWIGDIEVNYKNFCCNGLLPIRSDDLKKSQDILGKMLMDISEEIERRANLQE